MTASESARLIGTGIDLVHISAHAMQLAQPGSTFRAVYTDREWAYCTPNAATPTARPALASQRPNPSLALAGAGGPPATPHPFNDDFAPEHRASLAGCWAAKEAVIKAWSAALYGQEPPIDSDRLSWRDIELVHDRWKRPAVRFHGAVAASMASLALARGGTFQWHVSISHDGDYAIAIAHLILITSS